MSRTGALSADLPFSEKRRILHLILHNMQEYACCGERSCRWRTGKPLNADESLEAFGQHLRTARLRRGLTQASVAAMAGVSLRTLQKLEGGDPGVALRTAAAVMAALGFGTPFGELCAPKDDETGRLLDLARIPKRGRRLRRNDAEAAGEASSASAAPVEDASPGPSI